MRSRLMEYVFCVLNVRRVRRQRPNVAPNKMGLERFQQITDGECSW